MSDEIPVEPQTDGSLEAQIAETVADLPDLVLASELEEEPPEPAELGFEPDAMYEGRKIVAVPLQDERHAYLFDEATAPTGRVRSFYVQAKDGTIGLVPWPGSKVIWPHELAWTQDLYHEKQTPERQAIMAAFAKRQKEKQK